MSTPPYPKIDPEDPEYRLCPICGRQAFLICQEDVSGTVYYWECNKTWSRGVDRCTWTSADVDDHGDPL